MTSSTPQLPVCPRIVLLVASKRVGVKKEVVPSVCQPVKARAAFVTSACV